MATEYKRDAPSEPVVEEIHDLINLDPDQLTLCLNAMKTWVLRTKRLRAQAIEEGVDPRSLNISGFRWSPRLTSDFSGGLGLTASIDRETPIDELGLRRATLHQLLETNVYVLEDFSACSEDEIRRMKNMGEVSVEKIRTMLKAVGLSFRECENPVRREMQRALIAHRTKVSDRQLEESSPISQLGLHPTIARRLLEYKIDTVGALRTHTLKQLFTKFGNKSLTEIMETLKSLGLELQDPPSQLEMWRYGAIQPHDLVRPQPQASVQEIAPWVGLVVTRSLSRAGVATVAEARAIAESGRAGERAELSADRRIRGLGETGLARLQQYFLVQRTGAANGVPRGRLFPGG